MKTGRDALRDDLAVELITGLDQVPLPADPGGLRQRPRVDAPWSFVRATTALVATGIVVAIGIAFFQFTPQVGRSAGTPGETPVVAPTATTKADRTPEPTPTGTIEPRFLRLYWMYLPERGVLVLWDNPKVRAVRIVTIEGEVVASAVVRPAEPGEPRTCGDPRFGYNLVAVMPVPPEVAAEFKSGSPQFPPTDLVDHRVEAQQADGLWHPVAGENLLNRNNVAGAPCYQ